MRGSMQQKGISRSRWGFVFSGTASLVEMNVAASGDTTGITARSTPLASIHSSSPSAVSSFVWFHVWPRCV